MFPFSNGDDRFYADLESFWKLTHGDPSIQIAVLDTSIDPSHAAFDGAEIVIIDGPLKDGNGTAHGTAVGSILFGSHAGTVKGIAPKCRGLFITIYDEPTAGANLRTSQQRLAHAILLALERGAHVINISGGELVEEASGNEFLEKAIKACAERGVLVVAAAGNDGCACIHMPAALPGVLAVGAMDDYGRPLEFSNWGNVYRKNGILAPGSNILAAAPGNTYSMLSGTSYATPLVSGVVALLASHQAHIYKKIDLFRIREALLDSATPCRKSDAHCDRILAGRIDIAATMKLLFKGEPLGIINGHSNNNGKISSNKVNYMSANTTTGRILTSTDTSSPPAQDSPNSLSISDQESSGVLPTDCGCGCKNKGSCGSGTPPVPQLSYALGALDIDFGSEARRDSFEQAMSNGDLQHNITDEKIMVEYLKKNEHEATSLHWILKIDETPIYVVRPSGPYAHVTYQTLIKFLEAQENGVERISLPGYLLGATQRLLSGETVPVLIPEVRGMFAWSTHELVSSVAGKKPASAESKGAHTAYTKKVEGVENFLERVYYELRNLGVTASERAMNYAATNAYQVEEVFENSLGEEMELESINVEKSPICRQNSDCWDVKLTFFNPKKRLEIAKRVHRFTVDVSDVVPVTIGKTRSWYVY